MSRERNRYSRFVAIMKLALPAGALALVALIVLWPRLHGADGLILPVVEEVTLEEDGRVRLDHPRYVGEAEAGRAFAIEAAAALVNPSRPDRIELEDMFATFPLPDEGDVTVTSARATYDRARATVDLDGGIVLHTEDGHELRTRSAAVAIEAGTIETSTPVDGEGPSGGIAADRMKVEERGRVIRFLGNVKVTLPGAVVTAEDAS